MCRPDCGADVIDLDALEKQYRHQITPGFEPGGINKDVLDLIAEVRRLQERTDIQVMNSLWYKFDPLTWGNPPHRTTDR